MRTNNWIISLFMLLNVSLMAQHQLVLLNGNSIDHYFMPGETFRTKLRNEKLEHWGFIVEVSEFQVITSQDTIDISRIRKVLLPGRPLINKIGKTLITIGAAYMFIDQFNWVVIQKQNPSVDENVWKPSVALVGAGIPLLFFKKKWSKIKRGTHLISVDRKSKFYIKEMD